MSVTDLKGVTVNTGSSLGLTNATGTLTLDTAVFINNATVSGGGSASTLAFSDRSKNNLGVGNEMGAYTSFGTVLFSTSGNVNVGPLLNGLNPLDVNVSTVNIQAGGSVSFSAANPGATVASGGTITVNAGSLASTVATPITFNASGTSTVSITNKAALTVGTLKGNIAIAGSPKNVALTSTTGTLTVGTALAASSLSLTGSSVLVNKSVTGTAALNVIANGKTGVVTTATGTQLVSATGDLTVAQGSTALAKTAIAVNAEIVILGAPNAAGALKISNTDSVVAPGQLISAPLPIAALTYGSAGDLQVSGQYLHDQGCY